MIVLPHPQGSPSWLEARRGLLTASQFGRLVSPKTYKVVEGADRLLADKVTEWALGVWLDESVSQFMERGREMEDRAIAAYELKHDCDVERVGLCVRDEADAGASPDGLVGQYGGIEVKCPSAAVHVQYLLTQEIPTAYLAQMQGGMWVCERLWWDFLSWHPTLPPVEIRVQRDDKYCDALARAVAQFTARLEEAKAKLVALGYVPPEVVKAPFYGADSERL